MVRTLLSTASAPLAEKSHERAHREEPVRRLQIYDTQGEAYRHLTAPVSLHVGSSPAGAVAIARYIAEDRRPAQRVRSASSVGRCSPSEAVPGSYDPSPWPRPSIRPVRFPIVSHGDGAHARRAALPWHRPLPVRSTFPPADSSLWQRCPESVRRGRAEPLHPVSTGPYPLP